MMKKINKKIHILLLLILHILFLLGCNKKLTENPNVWKFNFSDTKWETLDYVTYYFKEKPYIWNDYIIFGNNTKDLYNSKTKGFYILDKKFGNLIINYPSADARFIIVNDTVYIGEDHLYALELNTFKKKWDTKIKNSKFSPFYFDGLIYLITKEYNSIMSFDSKNGKSVLTVNDEIFNPIEVNTKANILYYSNGFTLNALDIKSKKIIWKKNGEDIIYYDPILYNNYLFIVGGKRDTISVFNSLTGDLIWEQYGINKAPRLPQPIIFNERLFITTRDLLASIELKSGKIIWKVDYDLFDTLPFQIEEKSLYLPLFNKNKINQYDMDTGEIIKEIHLNNNITSPFSYEDGVIYYISENTLFAEKVKL